eukprot:CAMPEP_0169178780 /NCGR_PEP_ID=MMETSP1015-20121227/67242_1 /TAXON_ID=342587 /ORGANISM="Karlodinium micrum, Strain CCMP2283" /LENGTH=320 /DNA_ID=CAMNT_0009253689 /DNA_START=67 /DNA_END=1029 /DNA_ORIENTATION=-
MLLPSRQRHSDSESDDEDIGSKIARTCCCCCYGLYFMVIGSYYAAACCCCLVTAFLTFGAVVFAVVRNYSCSEEAVMNLVPPYGGQLFPDQVILREYWNQGFQFTKQIDVFDPAQQDAKIGYFFDMNFLFFFRFGYADINGRIWFEARRPWFYGANSLSNWWRRSVYAEEHYYMQRCDAGHQFMYDIDEDTQYRPWWCQDACMKILNVSKRPTDAAYLGYQEIPEARVHFNYTLEWYFGGFRTREAWNMKMSDASKSRQIAYAHQNFTLKNYFMSWNQRFISHWHLNITKGETNLPNWVIAFMTALDDIDEASETGKSHK